MSDLYIRYGELNNHDTYGVEYEHQHIMQLATMPGYCYVIVQREGLYYISNAERMLQILMSALREEQSCSV